MPENSPPRPAYDIFRGNNFTLQINRPSPLSGNNPDELIVRVVGPTGTLFTHQGMDPFHLVDVAMAWMREQDAGNMPASGARQWVYYSGGPAAPIWDAGAPSVSDLARSVRLNVVGNLSMPRVDTTPVVEVQQAQQRLISWAHESEWEVTE